jgi:hypothetical protein
VSAADPHPGTWKAMATNEHAADPLADPSAEELTALLQRLLGDGHGITLTMDQATAATSPDLASPAGALSTRIGGSSATR